MAAGTFSSRKKSSSRKKKPTKNSSEVRRKSSSRKGNKSKKRRRDVSVSCSDEDSRTEDSVSFSSSDSEDYRRGRTRSRTRGNTKGSVKRVRRSSLSHKDKRESPRRKKRKVSKRNDGSEQRKKIQKRKRGNGRSRRHVSVDSMSSDSRSCSTCRSGTSGGGSEFERSRGRYEGREKGKRSLVKRIGEKDRSRSHSPCNECNNDSSYEGKERLTSENYSRRLRSVLTVAKESEEEEGRYQSKDENKAEIIQAYDDCPSCRSNDSYEKRRVDDWTVEEAYSSKIRETQFVHSGKDDSIIQCGDDAPIKDVIGSTKVGNKSHPMEGDDLELVLRQKALENLRKFRGGLHTNTKASSDEKGVSDSGVNRLSTAKMESIGIESHKEAHSRLTGTKQIVAKDMGHVGIPMMERKSDTSLQNNSQSTEGNTGAINTRSVQGTSTFGQESSCDPSILNKASISKDSPKGKLLETRNIPDKSVAETPDTNGSNEPRNEVEGGSNFKQKTMSVMRGGEMVQVSYKVYIPNKAPALARRQLQR